MRETVTAERTTMNNRYFVYWDSTRKTFSVRDQQTRRVCLKADLLVLGESQFYVSERGRKRVLREKRKTVHAGILTDSVECPESVTRLPWAGASLIRYNPFMDESFVRATDGLPAGPAERVVCRAEGGSARVYAILK